MRAVSVAAFTGMMILAAGLLPARALPVCSPVTTAALAVAPPFLLPVRHHGHHWRWRHRHGSWSGVAPPYGPLPELDAREAPPPAPFISAPQPPAPAPSIPDRGGTAAVSRPSIEWVNPDRAAR